MSTLDNNFYNNQFDALDGKEQIDPEIEKLKLQREILKLKIELENSKNGIPQNPNIRNNIDYNDEAIDFEIVGGTIMVKTVNVKWKGGLKFSKGKTKNRVYGIVNEKIIEMGDNRYKILLKREGSSRTYEFQIKYKGGHGITIYNKYGRYMGRQVIETKQKTIVQGNRYRKEIYQTPGSFTIDTGNESIKLNIMFKN